MTEKRDWRSLDLSGGGRSLVEASAGTGKTWTISVLWLRLLLEQGLSPRQVVVATYTNAAAAELKERLRQRVESTLALAASDAAVDVHSAASDEAWLAARWQGDASARAADARRLALALAEFDLAPVSTLHGLCSRILADHPFAAGCGFRAPRLVDSSQLVGELTDDLWRLLQSDTGATEADRSLQRLAAPLLGTLKHDGLRRTVKTLLLPGVVVPEGESVSLTWDAAMAPLLREVVMDTAAWAKNASTLPQGLLALAEGMASDGRAFRMTDAEVSKLQEAAAKRSGMLKATASRGDVRGVLEFVEDFLVRLQAYRRYCESAVRREAQVWLRSQLSKRLSAANQLGFDDLLLQVHRALLPDENGARPLADALFAAWPVALIDEFQDTDPTQYGILDAIYRDAQTQPRGRLVMIGDPKQAIYRFRGGDIHTYERARSDVDAADRLSLRVNRRSSPAYVAAVNAYYRTVGTTLGSSESSTGITYPEAEAAEGNAEDSYRIESQPAPALVLHAAAEGEIAGETQALLSCADQIASLLSPGSGLRIGDRTLQPSDMAVLLPKNLHIQMLVGFLRERGVPCVNRGRGSVFGTSTAKDLLLILDAALNSTEPARIRAALATELWGLGYHALRDLREDASRWQSLAGVFHRWHREWQARGVLAVVVDLLHRLAARHLASAEGSRVLTDLRHLGELLQDFSDGADGPESVLAWLRDQIAGGDGDEEAAEARALRLESDARCVQVMTLHTSKGLEFPLVFLPLMWSHAGSTKQVTRLKSQSDGTRHLVLGDEAAEAEVALEEQDERFRVLYVALTRAKFACHVWLLAAHEAKKAGNAASPMDLNTPALLALREREALPAHVAMSDSWPRQAGARLEVRVESAGERKALPLPPPRSGPLPRRHSFTTLTTRPRGFEEDPWAAALDEPDAAETLVESAMSKAEIAEASVAARTPHAELDALLGAVGIDFGNAVHGVLELRELGLPLVQQRALILDQINAHSVRHPELDADALAKRLGSRLQTVLDTDLDGRGLVLGRLPAGQLRCELEFHYLLDGVSLDRLRNIGSRFGYPDLVPAGGQALAGLMNGKVDLIFQHDGAFHVLDWKGNHLGTRHDAALEDYAPEALELKMDATHYRLQALLYTVAVERYLRRRLSDYQRSRHLGDCWYLFVRAVGLRLPDGRACGIWRHRFDDGLLDAVQQELSHSQERAA